MTLSLFQFSSTATEEKRNLPGFDVGNLPSPYICLNLDEDKVCKSLSSPVFSNTTMFPVLKCQLYAAPI